MPHARRLSLSEWLGLLFLVIIVTSAVIVAMQPEKQFAVSQDAVRQTQVSTIIAAIKQDQIDNGGSYLEAIALLPSDTPTMIGDPNADCSMTCNTVQTVGTCVDISPLLNEGYLEAVPVDPHFKDQPVNGYYIIRQLDGGLTVGACKTETDTPITETR